MKTNVMRLLFLLFGTALFAQNYFYHEKTANEEAELVYKYYVNDSLKQDEFIIYSPITKQQHQITLDEKYATVKWINTKKDGTIDVYSREGNSIVIEAIRDGKKVNVKREINKDPWYASMEFGLGQYFRNEKKNIEFWNILPENLKAYKMKAEIQSLETIEISGTPVETMKVQVTINGIPAMFFHFLYWFRVSDGLFVRFEGAKGGPGAPKTIIEFVKIN